MGRSPKEGAVSAAAEARSLLEAIAGPQPAGGKVKTALARVARITGLGQRRVRALWNSEARRIGADEIETLRAAALGERPAHAELARLRDQINRLEWLLRTTDPDAAGVRAAPYREADRPGRRVDGAADRALDRD